MLRLLEDEISDSFVKSQAADFGWFFVDAESQIHVIIRREQKVENDPICGNNKAKRCSIDVSLLYVSYKDKKFG